MSKLSKEEKAAAKAAKEEEKGTATEVAEDSTEVSEVPAKKSKFSVKIYLEGHKEGYVKEFASQGELERAKEEFKKNKSIIRFE